MANNPVHIAETHTDADGQLDDIRDRIRVAKGHFRSGIAVLESAIGELNDINIDNELGGYKQTIEFVNTQESTVGGEPWVSLKARKDQIVSDYSDDKTKMVAKLLAAKNA